MDRKVNRVPPHLFPNTRPERAQRTLPLLYVLLRTVEGLRYNSACTVMYFMYVDMTGTHGMGVRENSFFIDNNQMSSQSNIVAPVPTP